MTVIEWQVGDRIEWDAELIVRAGTITKMCPAAGEYEAYVWAFSDDGCQTAIRLSKVRAHAPNSEKCADDWIIGDRIEWDGDRIEWDLAGPGTTSPPATGTITAFCTVLGQPGYAWVERDGHPTPSVVLLTQARRGTP